MERLSMIEGIDWGFVFTVGGFIIGVIALFFVVKKKIMIINPKTKSGKIDMSGSEYTLEKHIHNYRNSKREKR